MGKLLGRYDVALLGISGLAGSGKTTAADTILESLRQDHELDAVYICFADSLRQLACVMSGRRFSPHMLQLQPTKMQPNPLVPDITNREFLIKLAAVLKQQFGQDVCVRMLELDLEPYMEESEHDDNLPFLVIVPDVRYAYEVDWIHKNGGRVLRIERPGLDTSAAIYQDKSESELRDRLDLCDTFISNSGSLEDFLADVRRTTSLMVALIKEGTFDPNK